MNKQQLRAKLTGMISSLEMIISDASEQTRELKELIRLKKEMGELIERIDDGCGIDMSELIALVREAVIFLHSFLSN